MRSFTPSSRTSGGRSVAAILASILAILIICGGPSALAAVEPFPAAFKIERIAVNGVTLHVRVGGQGPAVVLLHGFADTGDMWAPQLDSTEALGVELREFVNCIEQGKVPTADGHAGLRVVRILEAATQSLAQRGRVIELERARRIA